MTLPPNPETAPIEEVMDELVPNWREIARSHEDPADAVAEIRRRMLAEVDSLLDTYNSVALVTPRKKETS